MNATSRAWRTRLKVSGLVLLGQAIGLVAALLVPADTAFSARVAFGVCCIGVPVVLLKAARPVPGNLSMRWSAVISLSSAAAVAAVAVGLGKLTPPWLAEQHRSEASGILLLMYLTVLPLASVLGSFLGTFIPRSGATAAAFPLHGAGHRL